MENGILKITKGYMVVIKGARDRNLYYLKGSTVTSVMAALVDLDQEQSRSKVRKLSKVKGG